MSEKRDVSLDELEAILWQKHIDDHLVVCSFAKSRSLLRYAGVIGESARWKLKVLESRESLSNALTCAKNSRNGSYTIALVRRLPQDENICEGGLLTEEQAFGSYVLLIEFVDGNPVIYGERS